MSGTATFDIQLRNTVGKASANASRAMDMVPGIIYGGDKPPVAIQLEERHLNKAYSQTGFFSKLFELKVDGKTVDHAIIRDLQLHPVQDNPLHIDFMRVDANAKISVFVPFHFINDEQCTAIKRGGVLNAVMHEIEVFCKATNIPSAIDIDLTLLDKHGAIHLKDIKLPSGVEPVHPDSENTIATIVVSSAARSENEGAAEEESESSEE